MATLKEFEEALRAQGMTTALGDSRRLAPAGPGQALGDAGPQGHRAQDDA